MCQKYGRFDLLAQIDLVETPAVKIINRLYMYVRLRRFIYNLF